MKAPCLSLLICCSFLTYSQPGNGFALYEEGLRRVGQSFGTISYVVTEGATGSVESRFDLAGLLTATTTDLAYTLFGMETTSNALEIQDGDYTYTYDLTKQSGKSSIDKTPSDLLRYKSMEESRLALLEANGGERLANETVLNRDCERWVMKEGNYRELWLWKGLVLKAVVKTARLTYAYEATEILLEQPSIDYPTEITILK
ncbi:MAG: hypothetical protein ACI9RP_000805 [Cyclobacteriaceae bacterium]|jgi:hypothetical protein